MIEPTRYYFVGDNEDHTFCIDQAFPTVSKAAVYFSGGMESTLLLYIAQQLYGHNNVSAIFTDFPLLCRNKQSVVDNITSISHLLNVDPCLNHFNINTTNPIQMICPAPNQVTLWGFTKLFFDMEPLRINGKLTNQQIIDLCNSDRQRFADVISEFHLDSSRSYIDRIYDNVPDGTVYKLIRFDKQTANKIITPFDQLTKSMVIQLYDQLGIIDLCYLTRSCTVSIGVHCGSCWDCQNRHDAFIRARVVDKTTYRNCDVLNRR